MTRSNQQIKDRPILFSGQMVRAILDGHKTQTRRVVKPQPSYEWTANEDQKWLVWEGQNGWTAEALPSACPYGQPGDRLWVRETWANQNSRFLSMAPLYIYRADNNNYTGYIKWKPSIHMPRAASRILLEITDVRVERLRDITQADARAEGVEKWPDGNYKAYGKYAGKYSTAKDSFISLWESINGPESWEQNPWVWVVEFKRL